MKKLKRILLVFLIVLVALALLFAAGLYWLTHSESQGSTMYHAVEASQNGEVLEIRGYSANSAYGITRYEITEENDIAYFTYYESMSGKLGSDVEYLYTIPAHINKVYLTGVYEDRLLWER